MMDPKELPVYEALDRLGISYTRYEHEAAATMADLASFDEDIQAEHCKNLFLCNRQGTEFFLLLIGGNKKFRTAEVSRQIGKSRLSFCTPEQLQDKLGLTPGAVTPMGLVCPNARDVAVLIDGDVVKADQIVVHPCVNTASIVISSADLLRFIGEMKNPIQYVEITSYLEEA